MGIVAVLVNHILLIHVFPANFDMVSVVLPTSLVVIWNYAFRYCSALQTIIIPTYVIYGR